MAQAFEGIRVIDFTQVLAGPFAAAQLALLGADVVKIEQPDVGDQARTIMGEQVVAPGYLVDIDLHDFNRRMRERPGTTTAELRRSALDVASGYLAPQNHDKVGPNCAMASLSVDVARGGATARRAYTDKTNEMLAEFSRGIDGPDNTDPRAVRALALCVGGLIVARALDDNGLKHAFADACLDGVRRELETPS